ncbi:MAG: secretion protein HlyD family protein [bacterium P3]|nr:MAG: secretion protein HlyD family protein [bacterium P3]
MRKEQIFPASILEQSADQVLHERLRLSGVLYLIILFTLVGVLIAINFIHVDVHVRAAGMIKPREDHAVVLATASGFLETRNLVLNAQVQAGDTLAIIRSEIITAKLPALQKRKEELQAVISDLSQLTTRDPENVKLHSPLYKQDVLYYLSQWTDAESKRKQAEAAFLRAKKLYEANVIPLSDFEPVQLENTQAQNAVKSLSDYQKRQWQSDLVNYRNELRDIETQMEQISIQDAETVITAPVSGTIQRVQTLFDGTYVAAGQQLVELSPDGNLIAECYVSPKDIGYLHPGSEGRIQVSSFPYTEWGVLNGTVEEVFDDVTISSDGTQSFYKVYCSLDRDYLTLKNGYRGSLKKGMAIGVNFLVTRRTVFQLLYDNLDNWLNPNNLNNHE